MFTHLLIAGLTLASLAPVASPPAACRRIRPLHASIAGLLATAYTESITLRGIMNRLQASDLIIHIEARRIDVPDVLGQLQFITRAAGHRYVRIVIDPSVSLGTAVMLLAHELRHALEVAEHSSVVDQPSFEALYRRIGHPTRARPGGTSYDTRAARHAGCRAAAEVQAHRRRMQRELAHNWHRPSGVRCRMAAHGSRPEDDQHSAGSSAISDAARLATLAATGLLDSPPEEAFDRLTRLVARLLDAPTALVSLVDADRQFFKSSVGLSEELAGARQTPLSHSFCKHVVVERQPLVVADARLHDLVANNDAIRDYGVLAYVGMPLTSSDGQTLGTLCALDTRPREWSAEALATLKDLAAAVVAEIELRLLARYFHQNYVALRALEFQRDEMVQMLVHDLRNPLMSVMGGLELLAPAVDAQHSADLALAQDGAHTLHRMISDILDVSKGDAERLSLAREHTPPAEIVRAAIRQVHQLASVGGIALHTAVPEDLPDVLWDGPKLVRVFVNLLSNAIQHTRPSGTVSVAATFAPAENAIVWSVSDTGAGIPEKALPMLFEKFGHSTAKRGGYASSGLGLAFSRMIVEAHGGSIWVESEVGRGTSFGISLPLR